MSDTIRRFWYWLTWRIWRLWARPEERWVTFEWEGWAPVTLPMGARIDEATVTYAEYARRPMLTIRYTMEADDG